MRTTILALSCLICFLVWRPTVADNQERANLIRNGDFDRWEWREFTDGEKNEIKAFLKKGHKIEEVNLEIRGPLYRAPIGYGGANGRMADGKDAHNGKSLYLAAADVELPWGLYWLLAGKLSAGKEYGYEISLKGSGTVALRAWIGGRDTKTGEFKWLGFPDFFKESLTKDWEVHRGSFKVPDMGSSQVPQEDVDSVAIILGPGSKAFIDDFRLWETGKQ